MNAWVTRMATLPGLPGGDWGRREFLQRVSAGLVAGAGLGALAGCEGEARVRRPNIVTIFADDLGFSDIGCYGGEIDTPNLDALATGGVRLTRFYNTARCCPSRASLLTGLYAHEAGIGHLVYEDRGPGYLGNLNDRCVTTGQVLGDAGYLTMFVGKWHAGHAPPSRPEVRGFQRVTGVYPHIDSYWKVLDECDVYRDGEILIPAGENPVNPYHPHEEFYTSDFFTDVALDYLDPANLPTDRPFFLHLCYNAPHFPLEAPDDLIEKYRGRHMRGWDAIREERLERMKAMDIVSESQLLPQLDQYEREQRNGFGRSVPTAPIPRWTDLDDGTRRELDFRRAIYAAQVERLDSNVGRVIDHLRRNDLLDDTLVLFFADNGCSGETSVFGMNFETHRSDNYAEWRKESGWSVSQGQGWAGASNTPFRRYKLFVHEGGIATPLIAHWPAAIHQRAAINHSRVGHLIDVMPTLCELGGATYPSQFQGRDIRPARGESLLPWLTDVERPSEARTLYWQHETCSAVRQGDWKLVSVDDRDPEAWELYDLSEDRSETDDRIGSEPALADELQGLWAEWAEDVNAMPFPEER